MSSTANQEMGRAFQAALDEAAQNEAVRCVVLTERDAPLWDKIEGVASEHSPGFKVIVEETTNRSIRKDL